MAADLDLCFYFTLFPREAQVGSLVLRRKVLLLPSSLAKWELFTLKLSLGVNLHGAAAFISLSCFPWPFPLQLVHSGLQNKWIWVMIPVPPQLQAGKRSLIHLTFASKSPKCCRKEMSHTSPFLPSRPAPLLHHAVKNTSRKYVFPLIRSRKRIIVKTLWIAL